MISIQSALNGWIVRHQCENERDEIYVFQADEEGENEIKAFADVLWRIKSLCGPQESRYSAHRVMIRIEPGDKHSSHPDNQEEEE